MTSETDRTNSDVSQSIENRNVSHGTWNRPTLPENYKSSIATIGTVLFLIGCFALLVTYLTLTSYAGQTFGGPPNGVIYSNLKTLAVIAGIGKILTPLGVIMFFAGLIINEIRRSAYEAHLHRTTNNASN